MRAMHAVEEAHSAESGKAAMASWSLAKRIAFRFVCAYWVLYYYPDWLFRVGAMVRVFGPAVTYRNAWRLLNSFVAVRVLHLDPAVVLHPPTGSTDTAINYIQNFSIVIIAAAAAIVWSVFDRGRPAYATLHSWLRVWLRYSLLTILLGYGFIKVFPQQMAPTSMWWYKLIQPYGDKSPMGVLWSFIGSSTPYQIFSGAAEVTAASLLLFRRTTTLGAFVSVGVLLNVVMLNFSYDVPVKLQSVNLLLAALLLASPDLTKMARWFIFNRSVEPPTSSGPVFEKPWAKAGVVVFKYVFIAVFLFQTILGAYRNYQSFVANRPRPALQGLYEVETFIQNGHELPPLTTDPTRWRRVVIDFPTSMQVQMMDDSIRTYGADYSSVGDSFTLFAPPVSTGLGPIAAIVGSPSKKYEFAASRPNADYVEIQGRLGDDSLKVKLKRLNPAKFPLVSRGFHWVQESGFNP
jgi:hypothetical protein